MNQSYETNSVSVQIPVIKSSKHYLSKRSIIRRLTAFQQLRGRSRNGTVFIKWTMPAFVAALVKEPPYLRPLAGSRNIYKFVIYKTRIFQTGSSRRPSIWPIDTTNLWITLTSGKRFDQIYLCSFRMENCNHWVSFHESAPVQQVGNDVNKTFHSHKIIFCCRRRSQNEEREDKLDLPTGTHPTRLELEKKTKIVSQAQAC